MPSQADKCQRLAELHSGSVPFIIPNPWDAGSAKLLESLGFQALATTSAGFAYSLAVLDGAPSLEAKLEHCQAMAEVTAVPISVDFEDGYAGNADELAGNVERLIGTGVAGCSIEDFSRADKSIYDLGEAEDRVRSAVEAIGRAGLPFQLTARAENLLRGVNDLDDTILRLKTYEAAGADVLYAPGIKTLEELKTVTDELEKPFNVLVPFLPGSTVDELASHGAHRISLGAALTWVSLKPVLEASKEMLDHGTFTFLSAAAAGSEVQRLLATDRT